jgi:hypothetical protein
MAFIPLTSQTLVPFTPDALKSASGDHPVFMIRQPTQMQGDQLNARLMAAGLSVISQQTIRATIIDELFSLFDEEAAEKNADLLDAVWQQQELQNQQYDAWQERETERILDQEHGAPPRPPAPLPDRLVKPRDAARAQLVLDDVQIRSQRVRNILAERMDYGRRNAMLLVRLSVARVRGLPGIDALAFDDPNGSPIMTEFCGSKLREAMSLSAWEQLVGHIDSLYSLSEAERKNSGSLPDTPSNPNGLPDGSESPALTDGNLTESNIVPIPDAGSGQTILPSSTSTFVPEWERRNPSPTDAA